MQPYDFVSQRVGGIRHLYRSLGSISANLAEGYSRGTGKDRARFYEYALGSARESRDWHYKARHVLGDAIVLHRMELLTRVIQLLLVTVPQQRQRTIREGRVVYRTEPTDDISLQDFGDLLEDIPLSEP